MRLSVAKEKVKSILQNTTVVPALLGERGIGKTEVLKQVAQELGWGYQAVYPSSLEGPDFMGLVVKDLDAGVTRYLAPEFLPVEKSVERGLFPEQGLLVVEELNRAEVQTIHTLYPLLLERKINTHKVHDGWKIAVAMNPDSVAYTTVSMDMAALDRILVIPVEPHLDDYIDYSLATEEYDRDVLDYLNVYPDMLLVTDQADSADTMGKSPCPRAWTRVQHLRVKARIGIKEDPGDVEIVAGLVGSKAASSLFGYLRDREVRPIPAEDVIKHPEEAIKQIEHIIEKGRYDVLNITVRELVVHLPMATKSLSRIEQFALALPEELQVMFAKLIHEKRRQDFTKIVSAWPTFKSKVFSRILDAVQATA